MKPVYLEFCGVNSFSETASIDFRKLLNGGLFGIFGNTGSGKSTILDSIHFALYGKIERASGAGADCINYNCDKATVLFDFEIVLQGERRTYRVQRERRRKNNVAKAFLYEQTKDGKWLSLAEKTSDVDDKLQEIIGLSFDDFKKCIALPQGEFAGLVQSTPKERLTLISRLFDLEKYGDRLGFAIRRKCDEITRETDVLQAKMQENDGGREEVIAQKTVEIELLKKQKTDVESKLLQAETTLVQVEKLHERKLAYDSLNTRLQAAQTVHKEYSEKSERLHRAEQAKIIYELYQKALEIRKSEKGAQTAVEEARKQAELAAAQIEKIDVYVNENKFDENIEKLTEEIALLTAAQTQIAACKNAKEKLEACTRAYSQLKEQAKREKIIEEDFDGQMKALEVQLETFGADESFTEFLKRNFKNLMVAQTHQEIQNDLTALSEKYPQTQEDINILKEKYTVQTQGDDSLFDVAQAKKQFDEAENARKELKRAQSETEQRKKKYQDFKEREARVIEDGKRYREEYNEAQEKIAFVKEMDSLEVCKQKREALRKEKERATLSKQTAMEKSNTWLSEIKAQTLLKESYTKQAETQEEIVKAELLIRQFESVLEVEELLRKVGDVEKAKAECEQFFENYNVLKTQTQQAYEPLFDRFDENALTQARTQKLALEQLNLSLNREIAVGEDNIQKLKEIQKKYLEYQKELAEKEKQKRLWEQLKAMVRGSQFMEYIASEYLQEVCVSASRTLNSLTNGRYFLRYDKEFKVGDNLNSGDLRAVKTLSGGETFLVSLSLALSLSNSIFARSMRPIEFFFLDEGFGTLDAKLVDTVMDVLGKLSKNFAVGLISHVEELKHRIENKIVVTGATETSGSRLKVETY